MAHPNAAHPSAPGPYDAPIPGVAGYGQAALLAKTAYQNTLARINRQRGDTLRQYGYTGSVDPTSGVIGNLQVDPHNPYGNLQSLYRVHAQQDREADWANQERGLRGGLANQARSELHFQHGGESAQLGTALTGTLADYQDTQTQAAYERDQALYQAQLEAARNAIANGDFNPAAVAPLPEDDSGLDFGQPQNQTISAVNTVPSARAILEAVAKAMAAKQKPTHVRTISKGNDGFVVYNPKPTPRGGR